MQPDPSSTHTRRRLAASLLLGFALLLAAGPAPARESGKFDVRSANTRLQDGVHYLSARVDLRLSDEALEALESGVELTVEMQIEVSRNRNLLPDNQVADLSQSYLLSYQPLSQRYLVKNVNSGEQSSHATLFAALSEIGRISTLPIIDDALLRPKGRYEMRMRAVLDRNTLPGPLRLFVFWGDSFRLESEWYTWSLSD